MRYRNDDEAPRVCICKSCGEAFRFGSEGDNESYHLRCEREDFLMRDDRAYPATDDFWERDDYGSDYE